MKFYRKSWCLVIVSIFFLNLTYADATNPVTWLKDLTGKVFSQLEKQKELPKNKRTVFIYDLIDKILLPYVDLDEMARAVVGRNAWNKADDQVQRQFIQTFKRYVINTYMSALSSYDGQQKMHFQPLKGEYKDRVQVISNLHLSNGAIVKLQYNLKQNAAKGWKIYDFSVDGISLVKNYNAQFASILRNEGLAGLVQKLKEKNG